ncbi:MAG: type II toxin-antitoxin system prevent-host-death family antitoxin [Thiotrichaceae bacterium]|nr:type II toxin-antitoxin system prevent-host-death family antitoxin [Thiotrichaceae bacterium]
MNWQLAEAKNKFSEVVRMALLGKLQRITRRGETVILMSEEHYDHLTGKKPSMVEYLMSAPSLEGLDTRRDKAPLRDVKL